MRLGLNKLFPTPFSFLESFAGYLEETGKPRYSLKESYILLYRFLQKYGGGEEAAHVIKMDVLGRNERSLLPDGIEPIRDPAREMAWMHSGAHNRIRVEHFAYDGVTRVYDLSARHPVTGEFMLLEERVSG